MNVNPVHDEFFKAQDLADALVRESIQNSLDARVSQRKAAIVKFALRSGERALPMSVATKYFAGLQPHLAAQEGDVRAQLPEIAYSEEERVRDRRGAVPFLVIEDFGTRGLTGDPLQESNPDAEEKNHFDFFWRNVGRNQKDRGDRGRWGLGKAVFTVASRLRAFFGLTVQDGSGRTLLMGEAVLRVHWIERTRYSPYGFFAKYADELPVPFEESRLVEMFRREFGLARREGESGLSIVIPFLKEDELRYETILGSVINQYFYPIMRGDLVVMVEDGDRHERLDATSLDAVASRLIESNVITDASTAKLCDLTRWAIGLTEEELIRLPEPSEGAPKWTDHVFPDDRLQQLAERFERNERLAFRVPVLVKRKQGGKAAASFFDVFLERDDIKKGEPHFIRRGITIPDIDKGKTKPVRGLVVAFDDAISTLLGDAENPAHSDWSERADKIKTRYVNGASTVRYVKNSLFHLATLLSRAPTGVDRTLLSDFFSVEAAEAEKQSAASTIADATGDHGELVAKPITASRRKAPVSIGAIRNGFTIRGNGDAPERIRIEVAYRVRSGNPFRKYSPFDFKIAAKNVSLQNASLVSIERNVIDIAPTSGGYQVSVTGFDHRRDLVVRTEPLAAEDME